MGRGRELTSLECDIVVPVVWYNLGSSREYADYECPDLYYGFPQPSKNTHISIPYVRDVVSQLIAQINN